MSAAARTRDGDVVGEQGLREGIRVLVVDDHQMFADSLVRLLGDEDDIAVLGTARTGAEALETLETTRPDVVLLDFQLPDLDGAEAAREILAVSPTARIVVVTGFSDRASIKAALDAGCVGFLTKDRAASEVAEAVRSAHADDPPPSHEATTLLLTSGETERSTENLTDREREVLLLISRGMSNQSIADEMFISVNTVRNHVQNVNRKLGVNSKLEAASVAVQRGVIPRPRPGS